MSPTATLLLSQDPQVATLHLTMDLQVAHIPTVAVHLLQETIHLPPLTPNIHHPTPTSTTPHSTQTIQIHPLINNPLIHLATKIIFRILHPHLISNIF